MKIALMTPTGSRVRAAAALVPLVAALAACSSSGSSTPAAAAGTAATVTTTAPAAPTAGGGSSPTSAAPALSTVTKAPAPGGAPAPQPAGTQTDCTDRMLKATAGTPHSPVNHLLITVTNTTTAPCAIYTFPSVKWDPAQHAPAPAIAASKPSAVVVIKPGGSAYAGLLASSADGSGKNGKHVTSITVDLAGTSGGSSNGTLTVAVPGGAYIDDSAQVTYWLGTASAALTY